MDTQNDKPKHQRTIPSEMEYHEKAHWKVGEDIITVVGGKEKQPIAFIRLEKYDENKKPILSCRDLDGNALAENTSNLYELKRDLKDKEIELTEAMRKKELSLEHSDHTETLATDHVEVSAPQPDNVSKTHNQEKGNELKKVRSRKNKKTQETEQTISH
jgi:hypothetical protein